MIASSWAWALGGVALFVVLGLLTMLALGVLALPAAFARRLGQTVAGGRAEGGRPLPEEVPDADTAEAAEQAGEPPER